MSVPQTPKWGPSDVGKMYEMHAYLLRKKKEMQKVLKRIETVVVIK